VSKIAVKPSVIHDVCRIVVVVAHKRVALGENLETRALGGAAVEQPK